MSPAAKARAVTDLLRRPEVAFQAMGDEVAKHLVNRAQIDRSMQTAQVHAAPPNRRCGTSSKAASS